jgi:leucyl/phenylalanyl-tRNA--protein transferase
MGSMQRDRFSLPWLMPGEPFPAVQEAWGSDSDAPGLLAAGADLEVGTLLRAYGSGIFPWFSPEQPILWWSPDPRMVLPVHSFRLHRSLRREIVRFKNSPDCAIRFDTDFASVIHACASSRRNGPSGTWIVPSMIRAYEGLHASGIAHSVETWVNDELVGGLYCVAIGRAVFGESMFSRSTNASKIALAALVAFCRKNEVKMIDCQQNTAHLASLGASEMPRAQFVANIKIACAMNPPAWDFDPLYWSNILSA